MMTKRLIPQRLFSNKSCVLFSHRFHYASAVLRARLVHVVDTAADTAVGIGHASVGVGAVVYQWDFRPELRSRNSVSASEGR